MHEAVRVEDSEGFKMPGTEGADCGIVVPDERRGRFSTEKTFALSTHQDKRFVRAHEKVARFSGIPEGKEISVNTFRLHCRQLRGCEERLFLYKFRFPWGAFFLNVAEYAREYFPT